jgi:hypothetical protein
MFEELWIGETLLATGDISITPVGGPSHCQICTPVAFDSNAEFLLTVAWSLVLLYKHHTPAILEEKNIHVLRTNKRLSSPNESCPSLLLIPFFDWRLT